MVAREVARTGDQSDFTARYNAATPEARAMVRIMLEMSADALPAAEMWVRGMKHMTILKDYDMKRAGIIYLDETGINGVIRDFALFEMGAQRGVQRERERRKARAERMRLRNGGAACCK